MKKVITLVTTLMVFSIVTFAQSDEVAAKIEYQLAEEEFAAKHYDLAGQHLNKAEELLGATNPKILYTRINMLREINEILAPATDMAEKDKLDIYNSTLQLCATYLSDYGKQDDERVIDVYKYKLILGPMITEQEKRVLREYFKKKNVKAVEGVNGVFAVFTNKGSGVTIPEGKKVVVEYTGRILDGDVFDSNVQDRFNHTQPFTFTLGKGEVIKGWEAAAMMMSNGAAATIYIPPSLAYGTKGTGPIPANAFLVFDMRIIDVN